MVITDESGKTYTQNRTFTLVTEQPVPIYGFYVNSSETAIYLNWTVAPEITTTGYRIYRKVNDGDFTLYASINNRETKSYIDMSVEEEKTYTYYMTAVSEMGVESDPCISFDVKLQKDEIAREYRKPFEFHEAPPSAYPYSTE